MSKKKVYQIISIFCMTTGIIILIPNTDWENKISFIGFFAALLGVVGSIISILIPNTYSLNFNEIEWEQLDRNYIITVPFKKHRLSRTPQIQTFIKLENAAYSTISLSENYDKLGNVTIKSLIRFNGKITLK